MIHTKIIATVGPATDDAGTLERLIEAGVSVFRLNFSHGTLESHGRRLAAIRAAAAAQQATVAVMGDLCGPKIRLGIVPESMRQVTAGEIVELAADTAAAPPRALTTSYPPLMHEANVGHRLLIDDGQILLRVVEASGGTLRCRVEIGGTLLDRKGINLPDTRLSLPAMTEKDVADAGWALRQGLDYLAQSFVRHADDLVPLRDLIRAAGSGARVVAKIEKPEAIENLGGIIEACDVLLVARGDLGVEMDVARVPMMQKDMIRRCRYAGRPAIVATQMLQSMVENPAPTRAEVSDVANAILDGGDAVMLSAETAMGRYPVEAVRVIRRIAEQTEPLQHRHAASPNADVLGTALRLTSGVARGAALLACDLQARASGVWTQVGNTPRLLSKHRLPMPVIGVSPDEAVCRRMAMFYGVFPVLAPREADESAMLARLDAALAARGLAKEGDLVIVVAGTDLTRPGSTNALLVHLVGQGDAVGREAT